MKKGLYILILLMTSFCLELSATHNKAGEITYERVSGNTYKIRITTYTDPMSTQADRCELGIKFGDGQEDTIARVNSPGGIGGCNPNIKCDCKGEILVPGKIQKNIYETTHTYAGNGTYVITMGDPNRVKDIKNIPSSVNVPFFLRTTLIISPLLGVNNSPKLTFAPIDEACECNPFYHNPGAVDADGDSLSYELSVCYGKNGDPIPGYSFPAPTCPNNTFSIDPVTGTLTWDGPGDDGIYNACILVREWRRDQITNTYREIGNVLRDMQIEVNKCFNSPPQFLEVRDTCVLAGDTLLTEIVAYDNEGDQITLSGSGEPLSLPSKKAIFNTAVNRDTVRSNFYWETACSHIRPSQYLMNYKAEDGNTATPLINFMTHKIRIVGPAPKNVTAQAIRKNIHLNWTPPVCNNVVSYEIYRKISSTAWTASSCEIGLPSYLGYDKIATVTGASSSSYIDNNDGKGLVHGQTYCYRIVPMYPENYPGYASEEACAELSFDAPIVRRNSVNITHSNQGTDSILWAKPVDIILAEWPPPYQVKIYSSEGLNSATDLVYTSPQYNAWNDIDTHYLLENINTDNKANTAMIELYSEDSLIGSTHVASSVFLRIKPDDRKLHLLWDYDVPWKNYEYHVFKEINGTFQVIDTVTEPAYTDSNLVNEREYRYFVRAFGNYSIVELPDTVFNNSQIALGIPKDTIPPCPPRLPDIDSRCELYQNELTWNNPNKDTSCPHVDAVSYNIYFTPVVGQPYELLVHIPNIEDTTILFDELTSVAGCYGITAIDTFGNESVLSERGCVDNCPIYELPNVFTPGGDGHNDFFHPLMPYRYIQDIDMVIYNRWGQVVFKTTDPDINWSGINQESNKQCPSGTYFYVCIVNEIRLSGIRQRELKGFITLVNQLDFVPSSE
ncbi:gliding motility-associated C-terminal domain-containing protein [bacterium SCSIO 12741]|nr:gliding motility-associated C-terminal domain-containing protein [bacterium SCSIO 12741]